MIGPLLAEVERLRSAMEAHRSHLVTSEAATRYALIDPVLLLLGWEVRDADRVTPEYTAGAASNKRVDYALKDSGKPVAFIEAKPLDSKLADVELEQLNTYCNNRSVRWGMLTNGDKWILVDASQFLKLVPDRVVLEFAISDSTPIDALQNLVTLFAAITGRAGNVEPAEKPKLKTGLRTQTGKAPAANDDSLPSLLRLAQPGAKCAVRLSFNDGHAVQADSWKVVLKGTLHWLVQVGRLQASMCPLPDSSGRTRYLVNTSPSHSNAEPFKNAVELANGLWFEANYGSANCVRNACHALQVCGVDPAEATWTPLRS